MKSAAAEGVPPHTQPPLGRADFLPAGSELREPPMPIEPQPWTPLSRVECLRLALLLHRAALSGRAVVLDGTERGE